MGFYCLFNVTCCESQLKSSGIYDAYSMFGKLGPQNGPHRSGPKLVIFKILKND